jgi:dihydropteroate synthase
MATLPQARPAHRVWKIAGRALDLARPLIMGVVNVTPDSFSDGGAFLDFDRARSHAERLIDEGADLIDIGGESTRPGAAEVSVADEIRRVVPLVEALASRGVPISVDTGKADVMQAAIDAGAKIVNDVRALREPGALAAVQRSDCGIVLMHMQGTPRTMQQAPTYVDVVREVSGFLRRSVDELVAAGVDRFRVAIDPGFGFGKSVEHNFALLRELGSLSAIGCPIVAGLSRKSMLGAATGRPVEQRLAASVAAALLAVERGADVVRVHDVAATRDALAVWEKTRVRSEEST